jgi:uncharacterized membrane protein
MSETPVQLIVAAFNTPDGAGKVMAELKEGKKAGLIAIQDAAVVVKDADGKLKVIDARRRSRRRRGLLTGGVVGGLVGLLAGPAGWAALGGGAIGMLAARFAGTPIRRTMEDLGESLTPNSSAIVALIEHSWVAQIEAELAAEGARVVREAIKADIAAQLQAGGNVLYSAHAGENSAGVGRVATTADSVRVSGMLADEDGVYIGDAVLTDEEPAGEEAAKDATA